MVRIMVARSTGIAAAMILTTTVAEEECIATVDVREQQTITVAATTEAMKTDQDPLTTTTTEAVRPHRRPTHLLYAVAVQVHPTLLPEAEITTPAAVREADAAEDKAS